MLSILEPEPPDQLLRLRPISEIPYETRLNSVSVARQINTKITLADQGRSRIRALTKGMLDGNPPYSAAERQRYGRQLQPDGADRGDRALSVRVTGNPTWRSDGWGAGAPGAGRIRRTQ